MGKNLIFIFFIFLLIIPTLTSFPQYTKSYKYVMELAKEALDIADFRDALHYLTVAQLLRPDSKEPQFYINLIKRLKEGLVEEITPPLTPPREQPLIRRPPPYRERERRKRISRYLERKERIIEEDITRERRVKDALREWEKYVKKRPPEEIRKEKIVEEAKLVGKPVYIPEAKVPIKIPKIRTLYLDDKLWATQPSTPLIMEIGKPIIIKGSNIERFLVVTPDIIEVERVDRDTLNVTANLRMGSTFFHVWDDKGRWTFHITVIFPKVLAGLLEEEIIEEGVEPFKFAYSVDWGSYYKGQSIGTMGKESLTLSQWVGLFGDTPYGKFDSSAVFTKFKESTEVTSYTVGLTDGKIGNFRNFNFRGVDLYERFSALSLPGTGLRGVRLEGRTFNDVLGYNLVWGRERVAYGLITAGVLERREEFIEGARVTLFPLQKNNYSFNYTQGYGSARQDYLKDRVVSLEAEHYLGDVKTLSECAFNGDSFAATVDSSFGKDNLRLRLNLRNIEKDFTTITARPTDLGEIGARFGLDYKFFDIHLSSDLDVYRDRYLFNPGKRHQANFDWDSSVFIPLPASSDWRTAFYYSYNPGLLSPRRSLRLNNTYSKRVRLFFNKTLSWFLGNTYQRSRFPLSASSDFNRYGLFGGLSFPLLENLTYYLNYEHSWVKECASSGKSSPRVITTGLNYSRQLGSYWFANLGLAYRDEEDALGTFSFLAGEDSLRVNLGLSYRPSPDFEFFLSGSLTNLWAENPDREAYNSAEIRWGLRSSWDLPFRWNPKGNITGVVFKDANGNMKKDDDEQGIPGIIVKVGRREVVTDEQGQYTITLRAKKLIVALDVETIPERYIFSTPSVQKIDIIDKKSHEANFGLTTQSGIYGVVFYDKNGNGKPDAEDIFIHQAKITLDDTDSVITDTGGSYFFRNIIPGKHTLKLDINSLPLKYLPLVKLTNEITLFEGKTYIFHVPLKIKP